MNLYEGNWVGYDAVDIQGGFWKTVQRTVKTSTVPAVWKRFDETGRFDMLKGDWKEGMPNRPHIFWDSDIAKWIEGAAYFLKKQRDSALEAQVDELIDRYCALQQSDGYLNAYYIVIEPENRFTVRNNHELYCAGHLIEAAIAYFDATGKRKLLDAMERYVELIDKTFRIEHSAVFDSPGHEEIELALMRLYHFTGEEKYHVLAQYFINVRGASSKDALDPIMQDMSYTQSKVPVREQEVAEGHAVRQLYLLCGMADVAKEDEDDALLQACERVFDDIYQHKMQITGGVGSTSLGESFTFAYDLPEYTTYDETCASIALAMFCRRMWTIRESGSWADCAERAIYNTVLSGMSLSGDRFYYENPLAVNLELNKHHNARPECVRMHVPAVERAKVFSCSCCPPNLIRFVASIGDYMYSTADDTIYTQCYMNGDATIDLNGKKIVLLQHTAYPYSGEINIDVRSAGRFTIAIRIPDWCSHYTLKVNGERINEKIQNGYVKIERSWNDGDSISVMFDLTVRVNEANPHIDLLGGKVALSLGPMVYCLEQVDNPNVNMRNVRLYMRSGFNVVDGSIAGVDVPVIECTGKQKANMDSLYGTYDSSYETVKLRFIPYFARENRNITSMTTWILA